MKELILTMFVCMLFAPISNLSAQVEPIGFDVSKYDEVNPSAVWDFTSAKCWKHHDSIHYVANYPIKFRSMKIAEVFEPMKWQSFTVYFSPNGKNIYEVHKGKCRGLSVSFDMKMKGLYWVRFWNRVTPVLIQADARELPKIRVTHRMMCSLHGNAEGVRFELDKHQDFIGRGFTSIALYYKMGFKDNFNLMQEGSGVDITEVKDFHWGYYYLKMTNEKGCFYYSFEVGNEGSGISGNSIDCEKEFPCRRNYQRADDYTGVFDCGD